MQAPGKSGVIADINITPLLDLAWVLLVIFILTTTAMVQSVEVKLPETPEHKEELPTDVATVAIDRTGRIFLNDEAVDAPQLQEKLRLYKLANPALPVILRADRALVYDDVVKVIDSIKRVGVENLALATEAQ
ncbi:MAG: biopolymer transporter ExbD [Myxococcota bacterium]